MRRLLLIVLASLSGIAVADIRIVSPKEGEVVQQLWPEVRAFLDMPRAERQKNAERMSKREKQTFKAHRGAKPVEFAWTGAKDGVYELRIMRKSDGREFHASTVTGLSASVASRLEIGREWTWTVSDGKATASGRFLTEDRAPRMANEGWSSCEAGPCVPHRWIEQQRKERLLHL